MKNELATPKDPDVGVPDTVFVGDELLPVRPMSAIRLYVMVETEADRMMEQIELGIKSEQAEAIRRARHLMVVLSIWEDGDTQPSRTCHLIFPPDMFQSGLQCKSAFQASASAPILFQRR